MSSFCSYCDGTGWVSDALAVLCPCTAAADPDTCAHCEGPLGADVRRSYSTGRTYCSRRCLGAARRKMAREIRAEMEGAQR